MSLLPVAGAALPGLLRLATGAYVLQHAVRRRRMHRRLHRSDAAAFAPVGPVRVLRRPLPPRAADALFDASLVSGALMTAGVAHRVVGPIHAALLTWVYAYRNSFSMVYHHENPFVLHTMVLGLAPAADALSVDALRRDGTLLPPRRSWMYGATPLLMNAVSGATYAISGAAKLAAAGPAWAGGEHMRSQVAADALRKEMLGERETRLGRALYPYPQVFAVLAAGSLVLELAAPLAVLDHRCARAIAVGAYGMHVGIRLVMGITFPYQLSGVMFLPMLLSPARR